MSVTAPPPRPGVVAAGVAASRRFEPQPRDRARLVRRRWMVGIAKRLLPLLSLALLVSVVLWPELVGQGEHTRLSYRRGGIETRGGEMTEATYHGVDARGRPYTMTAATARQAGPERVDLTLPKGDMTLESGSWLLLQSRQGVYLQHAGSLDLSGDVQIYRDDGTTVSTSSATVDLKAGAAAGAETTHAEGPFGTLDAQGFAVVDRGTIMQFPGPGRMVLNASRTPPAAAGPVTGVDGAPVPATIAPVVTAQSTPAPAHRK